MVRPEILIIMSDQHNASITGFGGNKIVNTPNMDFLSSRGVTFDSAYTSCPLCVPARLSFMTCQSPVQKGWFDNDFSLGDNQATFMHSLTLAGYETVLCGRMHFMGEDQLHGFTKRIMGDFTFNFAGGEPKRRAQQGPYALTTTTRNCLRMVGGSDTSPVLEYDRAVARQALDYMNDKYEKPQCLLVGLYGPHFPFVGPKDLYQKYLEKIDLPKSQQDSINYRIPEVYEKYAKPLANGELIKRSRAAYFAMVENLDNQLGQLRDAWENYLVTNNKKGIIIYLSDHGESAGEKNLFGKMNFFEESVRIPMIFYGDNIAQNVHIKYPVSIMDVGMTLCDLTGAKAPPKGDGQSLFLQVTKGVEDMERKVYSEFLERLDDGSIIPGRMMRYYNWKMIRYKGLEHYDLLFNLADDPGETNNLTENEAKTRQIMSDYIEKNWDTNSMIKRHREYREQMEMIIRWNQITGKDDPGAWRFSEEAVAPPEIQ